MKIVLILLIGMIIISCQKEDSIIPYQKKNFYVIEEKENMDEVDRKIWEIYQKFNIPIFYNDTIGYEDRGWRDKNGNTVYYYEVLNVNYDMTENYAIQSERIDVSTPEKKRELLPILELFEEVLFPMFVGVDTQIPAVLLTKTIHSTAGTSLDKREYLAYRCFNFLAFAIGSEREIPPTESEYIFTFMLENLRRSLSKNLDDFYNLVIEAVARWGVASDATTQVKNFPWGRHIIDDKITPQYYSTLSLVQMYQSYYDIYVEAEQRYNECMEEYENAENQEDKNYWLSLANQAQMTMRSYETLYNSYLSLKSTLSVYNMEHAGWLGKSPSLGFDYTPTRDEDTHMYLEYIVNNTYEECLEMYGDDYPYIPLRYKILEEGLSMMNFDLENLKNLLQ